MYKYVHRRYPIIAIYNFTYVKMSIGIKKLMTGKIVFKLDYFLPKYFKVRKSKSADFSVAYYKQ